MASFDRKISVLSLNVQGLRNPKKRHALFRQFKLGGYDVVALQETYLLEKDKELIKKEWRGCFHLSEGTTHSKGLLTLFNNSFDVNNVNEVFITDRIIISLINLNGEQLFINNVYSPTTDQDKYQFLENLQRDILQHTGQDENTNNIVLGDFNIVKNNKLDIISGQPHTIETVNKFNRCINEMQLNDIWRLENPFSKRYTWKKHRGSLSRRLDYIFISDSLVQFAQDSDITFLGFSDHSAVSLVLNFTAFNRGPSTFKMNVNVLKNTDFIDKVKEEIYDLYNRLKEVLNPHLIWECIKAQIKALGRRYSIADKKDRNSKRMALQSEVTDLETKLAQKPQDIELLQKITNAKNALEVFLLEDTRGAQIRAGIKYQELGEKCNKFFLNLEKQRSKNNTIYRLVNKISNEKITDCDEILEHITDYFENIYRYEDIPDADLYDNIFLDPVNSPKLDEGERARLDQGITEEEVLSSLKLMKNGAAPGLDGIPIEVYKVLWQDVKTPLLNCIKYSFEVGILSPSQRKGMICLLHKGKGSNREDLGNWRPISLTNSDYKLIAKILACRLKTVINSIIHESQFAFMKGRYMADMLRELDDIVEYEKYMNRGSIILSIDYSKAFDTLSIASVIKALKHFGFGPFFIRCVETIMQDRLSCVRNGGYISRFFKMARGVRQGCPVSPLLFILTAELFMKAIRNDNNIKGIKLPYCQTALKGLQYADDASLFLRDRLDFREVLSKIKKFSVFSGLHMNTNKTYAMQFNGNGEGEEYFHGIKFVNNLKILGIIFSKFHCSRDISDNIDPKIESLERMCSLWSKRNLSLMGKVLILKCFGLSLFIHTMQSIGIKQDKLDKVNSIFFRFLWDKGNGTGNRIIEKVKRTIMCNNIEDGGLKMINIKNMQASFYLHWVKKLLSPADKSWKYIPKKFIEPLGGTSVFSSNVTLVDFKGMYLGKNSFWNCVIETWLDRNNTGRNNDAILTYNSPLFNNTMIKFKNKTLFFRQCIAKNIIYIKDLLVADRLMNYDDFLNIYGRSGDSLLIYNVLYNALLPVLGKITRVQNNNVLFSNCPIGDIGRKKFEQMIRDKHTPHSERFWEQKFQMNFNKCLWTIHFEATKETKLLTLQWKILQNIFPTSIFLHKIGLKASELCDICGVRDTVEHFFVECRLVKPLWLEVGKTIEKLIGRMPNLMINEYLLGILNNNRLSKEVVNTINYICLIGKMVISRFKYGKHYNIIYLFENEIQNRGVL